MLNWLKEAIGKLIGLLTMYFLVKKADKEGLFRDLEKAENEKLRAMDEVSTRGADSDDVRDRLSDGSF